MNLTPDATPITIAYLEALLARPETPAAAPKEIMVQAVKAKPAPLLMPPTFEEKLLWLAVEGYLKGDSEQQEFAHMVHATYRENEALKQQIATDRKMFNRLFDLSDPGPVPKGGFAKLKVAPARQLAEYLFNNMLMINAHSQGMIFDD
jgi:hypothetical protein